MKYLAEVTFKFRVEIDADSEDEALDIATLGTTLESLNLCKSDFEDYFPSSAKVIREIHD